jgi:uncharacterized membrane protein (UPF0182 family)
MLVLLTLHLLLELPLELLLLLLVLLEQLLLLQLERTLLLLRLLLLLQLLEIRAGQVVAFGIGCVWCRAVRVRHVWCVVVDGICCCCVVTVVVAASQCVDNRTAREIKPAGPELPLGAYRSCNGVATESMRLVACVDGGAVGCVCDVCGMRRTADNKRREKRKCR